MRGDLYAELFDGTVVVSFLIFLAWPWLTDIKAAVTKRFRDNRALKAMTNRQKVK